MPTSLKKSLPGLNFYPWNFNAGKTEGKTTATPTVTRNPFDISRGTKRDEELEALRNSYVADELKRQAAQQPAPPDINNLDPETRALLNLPEPPESGTAETLALAKLLEQSAPQSPEVSALSGAQIPPAEQIPTIPPETAALSNELPVVPPALSAQQTQVIPANTAALPQTQPQIPPQAAFQQPQQPTALDPSIPPNIPQQTPSAADLGLIDAQPYFPDPREVSAGIRSGVGGILAGTSGLPVDTGAENMQQVLAQLFQEKKDKDTASELAKSYLAAPGIKEGLIGAGLTGKFPPEVIAKFAPQVVTDRIKKDQQSATELRIGEQRKQNEAVKSVVLGAFYSGEQVIVDTMNKYGMDENSSPESFAFLYKSLPNDVRDRLGTVSEIDNLQKTNQQKFGDLVNPQTNEAANEYFKRFVPPDQWNNVLANTGGYAGLSKNIQNYQKDQLKFERDVNFLTQQQQTKRIEALSKFGNEASTLLQDPHFQAYLKNPNGLNYDDTLIQSYATQNPETIVNAHSDYRKFVENIPTEERAVESHDAKMTEHLLDNRTAYYKIVSKYYYVNSLSGQLAGALADVEGDSLASSYLNRSESFRSTQDLLDSFKRENPDKTHSSDKLRRFTTVLELFKAAYIFSISGKQVSDRERELFDKALGATQLLGRSGIEAFIGSVNLFNKDRMEQGQNIFKGILSEQDIASIDNVDLAATPQYYIKNDINERLFAGNPNAQPIDPKTTGITFTTNGGTAVQQDVDDYQNPSLGKTPGDTVKANDFRKK